MSWVTFRGVRAGGSVSFAGPASGSAEVPICGCPACGRRPATLYRRFPTKQDLVLKAFEDELAECSSTVYDSTADPDPWRGFCVVERTLLLIARNQGFTDAFMSAHPDVVDFAAHRKELGRVVSTIIHRAQAAGRLRPDFVFHDFVVILLAGRGLTAAPASTRDAAVRRFAAFMIDRLRVADIEPGTRASSAAGEGSSRPRPHPRS